MLTGPKIQAKILSHSRNCDLGERHLMVMGEGLGEIRGNGQRLRSIQHSMSMVLDTRFHIWLIMAVYYKMRQILLQNARSILLQNTTGLYTKCDSYYKMRRLLQIACISWYNKVTDFRWKNTDVSRTQGVYYVFFIFLDFL